MNWQDFMRLIEGPNGAYVLVNGIAGIMVLLFSAMLFGLIAWNKKLADREKAREDWRAKRIKYLEGIIKAGQAENEALQRALADVRRQCSPAIDRR